MSAVHPRLMEVLRAVAVRPTASWRGTSVNYVYVQMGELVVLTGEEVVDEDDNIDAVRIIHPRHGICFVYDSEIRYV